MAVLGIDTSNYTTSLAIYNENDQTFISKRQILNVASGGKGLRQSDAVFQHTKNLPILSNELFENDFGNVNAIGVSATPRDTEGSYMPCFLAGVSAATMSANIKGCRLYKFSHQRGHIAAAAFSTNNLQLFKNEFFAFHISGGTTELLHIKPNSELIIECNPIAVTEDLNAGQVIDRVGVMLGINFPCGKELETLALRGMSPKKFKPVLKNGNCCLSGLENMCSDMLNKGEDKCNVARFCIDSITKTVAEMTEYAIKKVGKMPILYAGGVMSDIIIKNDIEDKFDCVFSTPELSTDNAVGIAVLTAIKMGYLKI